MSFFLSLFAQQTASMQGLILPIVLFGAAIYFLMIRPAQKQRKKAEELRDSIVPGDEVVTIGAWKGTVLEVDDEGYLLQLGENTTAYILRAGIARKVINDADLIDEDWDEDEDDTVDETATDAVENKENETDDSAGESADSESDKN